MFSHCSNGKVNLGGVLLNGSNLGAADSKSLSSYMWIWRIGDGLGNKTANLPFFNTNGTYLSTGYKAKFLEKPLVA